MKTISIYLILSWTILTSVHAVDLNNPMVRKIEPAEFDFFAKKIDFEGIEIKSHRVVSDSALLGAYSRLKVIFLNLGPYRESILMNLRQARVEIHVIGRNQVTTDLPEWRKDKGKPLPEYNGLTRDERTRGMGGSMVSCGEENLLKLVDDRYNGRDILVHEFCHCIRNFGLNSKQRSLFDDQYRLSLGKGLWLGSYAATNADEFFSELSMWYFGTHGDLAMEGRKPGNGAKGLREYDLQAYNLFDQFYGGKLKVE